MRIFDLCVVAFAHAQARYHRKVHDRLGVYVKEYLDGIKRSPRLVQGANESRARTSTESARPVLPPDLGTGAGVERHWREAWHTYANAVESFQIITPGEFLFSYYILDEADRQHVKPPLELLRSTIDLDLIDPTRMLVNSPRTLGPKRQVYPDRRLLCHRRYPAPIPPRSLLELGS